MSASFSAILPPPQTIDTLDNWGDLDSLLWSLDGDIWTWCGIYGFTAEQTGKSSQTVKTARIRTQAVTASAKASGSFKGESILDLSGSTDAVAGEDIIGGVARAIPVSPASASSSQTFTIRRVRPGSGETEAFSDAEFEPFRVRMDVPGEWLAAGVSGSETELWRVLQSFIGSASATSDQSIYPEYKGWTWGGERRPEEGDWSLQERRTDDWSRLRGASVTWDRKEALTGRWVDICGPHNKQWKGVVQWQ